MDRFDAVTACEFDRRRRRDPDPLRHVPADRDRRAGVQGRRRERDGDARSSCSRRARPTRSGDPRDRPDRGRARGDAGPRRRARRRRRASPRPGRSRASGTSWRCCACAAPRRSREVGHRAARAACPGSADAHDGRVRGLLAPRPRGAVLDRQLVVARAARGTTCQPRANQTERSCQSCDHQHAAGGDDADERGRAQRDDAEQAGAGQQTRRWRRGGSAGRGSRDGAVRVVVKGLRTRSGDIVRIAT